VIAMLAVSALLDQDSGVAIWLELREDLASSTARVDLLVAQNDSLRSEIELLEADPTAIDRAIREELDLALPGEVVFRFRPTRSDGASLQ
jgi:cell division protein FtsB